ncbi:hypothetical protein F511_23315 [Dorcoceras hygrometricum]|uniref:DNA glycosylase superfamily protein n=1 Tax=Dorcoceras hygrometricum TaxID=472368 RepID=A0A2Z7D600_9LAMI|nr:hypothetical protein F511_23315 [Dorcoceras hygrometricum]
MPGITDKRTQPMLAPNRNRVRVVGEGRRTEEPAENPSAGLQRKSSADSSSDSSSSSSSSSFGELALRNSARKGPKSSKRAAVKNGNAFNKPAKIVPDGIQHMSLAPQVCVSVKRCDWITPNSDPLYTSFHDEEWGVPVHDDVRLFELLVFSQALAEFSLPTILSKRAIFRRLFNEFDPAAVANLDLERLLSTRVHGNTLLSETKLRAVVENARQLLKIQQEYGSFSTYCWHFVNHKQIRGGFRHARQIPTKTPKSEIISKDLMQRGFCCVGPTVVYSFMQMAGIVNDHLLTCSRYNEYGDDARKNPTALHTMEHILEEAPKKTSVHEG